MTIKVYKKRVHWYYIYQCQEYSAENFDRYLDTLSELLNSKNIYFKITNRKSDSYFIGRLMRNTRYSYFLDPWPLTFLYSPFYHPEQRIPYNDLTVMYIYLK